MIEITNFTKRFDQKVAVEDLSFTVEKGSVFALLGANGSGKTTTIRCLLGIYEPSVGKLLIGNRPYSPDRANELGYLPEERGLYLNSSVMDVMTYFGELKGVKPQEARQRALQFLESVELAEFQDRKIKTLSSGQQQKIQLGVAVINRPGLLILDEPTKGLDPVNQQLLIDLLLAENKRGATIMFSSHHMEMVEQLADNLVMIKDGQRQLYGKLHEVKASFGNNTIHLEYRGELPASRLFKAYNVKKHTAELTPAKGVESSEIIKLLAKQPGLAIDGFKLDAPSLEQVFVRVQKGEV